MRKQKCRKCGRERTLDECGLCHECWRAERDAEQANREGFMTTPPSPAR